MALSVGDIVYYRRDLTKGEVAKLDLGCVYIKLEGGDIKAVTIQQFNKYWITERMLNKDKTNDTDFGMNLANTSVLSGELGIGKKLADKFIGFLKSMHDDKLTLEFKDPKKFTVWYDGYTVFRVEECRRKLVVYAHPKSLLPVNMKYVAKVYPKNFYQSLRAKFVFTEESQIPIMRSIISDGIYYRK